MAKTGNQTMAGSKLKLPAAPASEEVTDDTSAEEATPDTSTPYTTDKTVSDTANNVTEEASVEQETQATVSQQEESVEEVVLAESIEPAEEETQTFEAPTNQTRKKKFLIERDGKEGLWVIKLGGGGKVPGVLSGSFTSHDFAGQQIENYLEK